MTEMTDSRNHIPSEIATPSSETRRDALRAEMVQLEQLNQTLREQNLKLSKSLNDATRQNITQFRDRIIRVEKALDNILANDPADLRKRFKWVLTGSLTLFSANILGISALFVYALLRGLGLL